MLVRELIENLIQYDMESEVEINCRIDSYTNETFDFDTTDDYQVMGKDKVFLQFELNGETLIDTHELETLRERLDELEDELESLKEETE